MAAVTLESNKAKIAKRVIEVLEFFGARNQPATVMDIARRYGRPQSSTSELLSSLVEMGLLYKDPSSRAFTPTPRLATLGVAGQPEIIRDGRLFNYMDRLAQTTRETVALFGMVGTHAQVFRWISGSRSLTQDVGCGSSELLSASAAGLLLVSTMSAEQSRGLLWRLNAEAPAGGKFDHAEMIERVARYRRQGHAIGDSGFLPGMEASAVLLPRMAGERPLALAVLYPAEAPHDAEALVETLKHGVVQVYSGAPESFAATTSPFVRAV
jgi:DNA-binding IclR family transcriptional regulator